MAPSIDFSPSSFFLAAWSLSCNVNNALVPASTDFLSGVADDDDDVDGDGVGADDVDGAGDDDDDNDVCGAGDELVDEAGASCCQNFC